LREGPTGWIATGSISQPRRKAIPAEANDGDAVDLLADRFQLKARRESREGNVHALVVVKTGPKLKEPTSGDQSFIRLARYDRPEQPTLTYLLYG
jgi:uncharacterized protein (TIGR03435 family)